MIRAEKGPTHPLFRSRPDPARAASGPEWTAFLAVEVVGGLRIEGIDIVLAVSGASIPRRRAAFDIRSGNTDLALDGCTVTIEGDRA